jgi:superoxide reductase
MEAMMAIIRSYYKCEICGNIVTVLNEGNGTLVCCGQPMNYLVVNNGPEGNEKHIPVLNITENSLKVMVGSVEHPMTPEHYIQWIELSTPGRSFRQYLKPGEAPSAVFDIAGEQDYLVTIYCNVHGLWDNLSATENGEEKRAEFQNKY